MTFNFQIWRNAQYNFKKEYDRGISSAKVFPIIPQSLKSRKHTKKSCWVAASELEIPRSPYIIDGYDNTTARWKMVALWFASGDIHIYGICWRRWQNQHNFQGISKYIWFFLFHLISVQKIWWNIMKIRLFAWPVKTRTSIGRE